MIEESVWFDNDHGQRLFGIKHVPQGKPPFPTVIMYHGLAGTKSEGFRRYVRLARALARKGFLVFRYDYRGHGDSALGFEDIVMHDLVKDSRDILDHVKQDPDTNQERIGIVSRSLCPSLYMRVKRNEVKAAVLHCPAVYLQRVIERGWGVGIRYGRKAEGGNILNPEFWKDVEKYNPFKIVKEINVPMLFMTGDEDEIIWVDEVEELYQAANEPKKLVIIKYAGHKFWRREHEQKVHAETISWLEKYL